MYLSLSMVELLQKQVNVPSVGGYERQPLPAYIAPVEEQVNMLVEILLDKKPANKWVGIWGIGGSGKTLLARLINNDERVYDHFAGRIFFVIAGGEANSKELQKKLCHRLGCAYDDGEHQEETKSRLFEFFRNKISLLILDDVWEPTLLEAFDVLDGSNGSKMLITTHNSQVLDSKHASRIRSGLLAKESSIKLFSNFAFKEGEVPEELQHYVDETAGCCKGLPLALKVMGGAMAGKRELRQWVRATEKLKNDTLGLTEEKQLYHHVLKCSYDEVQTIERGKVIQECFLCTAAFPEDARISFAELAAWWRGEDLIGSLDDGGWDDAHEIVDILVSRSLIEPIEVDPYDVRYQIHDVLRKLVLVHINVLKTNQEEHEQGCLFLARKTSESELEEVLVDEAIMKGLRKISLVGSEIETLPSKVAEVPLMKTLLLNYSQLTRLNSTVLRSFNNLKVLGLRFTSRIKVLPEEIGILNQLQVLDLYQSSIEEIPKCIYGMANLRYLDLHVAKEKPGIRNFEFGELHKLSKLEVFHLLFWFPTTPKGKDQRLQLESVGSLTRLTSLALISQGKGRMSLPPSMTNLVNLRYLDARCDNLHVEELQRASPSFTKLETCTMGKARGGFGKEMVCRSNRLKRFKLQLVGPFSEDLSHELQRLRYLELTCDSLPESFASPSAFPSLLELTFEGCTFNELPDFKPGALPKLSKLALDGCDDLLHLPQSVTLLASLAELQVKRGLKRLVLEEDHSNSCFIGLQRLEVTDTKLKYLPRAVATAPCLESILLYFNRELQRLLPPEEEHVEGFFPKLTSLRIMDSNLTLHDIPAALTNRPKLTISIS